MLIDTGSAVTLVREDVWREATQPVEDDLTVPVRPIVAANGGELELLGKEELRLQVGELNVQFPVLIARELTQECILGADFLKKHKCVVNMGDGTLVAGGKPVMCEPKESPELLSVCHVSFSTDAVIPGQCQLHLPVSHSKQLRCSGVLEPAVSLMEHQGLLIARSVCSMEEGSSIIRVLNPSPTPVAVYKNQKVGVLQPLTVADGACTLEESDRDSSKDKSILEEIVKQMTSRASDLSSTERDNLQSLLFEFEDVISRGDGDLGCTGVVKHKIDTGNATPIRQPPRRLPFNQRDEVRNLVDQMLSRNVIEPAQGPWSSPIVLVKKKDGSTRFCVDFRKVNEVTKKDAQSLPRIDDTLDTLGAAKWFSTLDLASGYWQVEVEQSDREKTAFTTPQGLYQFRVMPFGLCNAPGTFQRLMERVLAGLHWTSCLVYLDDIIIFSQNIDDHLQKLREVFLRLQGAGLKIKPIKCFLMQRSVHYLGHVVSSKGVETDPKKVSCIKEWPTPKDVKELRQFLGLASYYRRFIKSFALKANPLYRLTEKGRRWEWTKECGESFTNLKQALASAPILAFPNFDNDFILDTDASTDGLGAVLSQQSEEGERVIAYASRTLTKAERQYCATRREMLALVWGVRQFRPYLYGRTFSARTDHNSLRWLHNFREPEGQVARWLEILSEYNFQVLHRPGVQHGNADALSRSPCKQCGQTQEQGAAADVAAIQCPFLPHWSKQEICAMQQENPDLQLVVQWLHSHTIPPKCPQGSPYLKTLWHQRSYLTLRDGILYRRWEDVPGGGAQPRLQLLLPPRMVPEVLHGLHSSPTGGHLGISKTLEKARTRFYWPRQRQDIENWCNQCEMCSSRQSPTPKPRVPLQLQLAERPMERVAMDILGPLPETARGNKYILVIGDYFTKWKEAHAMPNMEAVTVAKIFVNEFICRFGIPEQLHTDQGRNFESTIIKEICKMLGITKTRTTPYHPQSDGMIERFNRTVLNMLSKVVSDDEHSWDLHLPTLMLAYCTSQHETTGATPFSLVYGREAKLPEDILFNLPNPERGASNPGYADALRERFQQAYQRVRSHSAVEQRKQKANYDQSARARTYEKGSLVWLHCPAVPRGKSPKFHRPWQGPFKVVKEIGDVIYRIQHTQNPKRRVVVHANRLKKYSTRREDDEFQEQWVTSPSRTEQTKPASRENTSSPETAIGGLAESELEVEELPSQPQQDTSPLPLRRSHRLRRPPDRYGTIVSFRDSDSEFEN